MGLDMYIQVSKEMPRNLAKTFMRLESGLRPEDEIFHDFLNEWDKQKQADPTDTVCLRGIAAYWRKANVIHNWFVQNVQGGNNDCKAYVVSTKKLKSLLRLCEQAVRTGVIPRQLEPNATFNRSGYALDDCKSTVTMLTTMLERFHDYRYEYKSSW